MKPRPASALGELIGDAPTILVAAGLVLACSGWVLASPLRRITDVPDA